PTCQSAARIHPRSAEQHAGVHAFTGRNALLSRAYATDDGLHHTTTADKKTLSTPGGAGGPHGRGHLPSWADESQGNPGFRCLQDQLDPTINVMSSPSLVFSTQRSAPGEARWSGRRNSGGTDYPWGRRFVMPMLMVVVTHRQQGRRRRG